MDDNHVLYSAGNTFQIMNLTDKTKKIYFSKSGGGVGCVCSHPSKKFFAVGEKGHFPCIFIYSYPEIKLYRILCKGTE